MAHWQDDPNQHRPRRGGGGLFWTVIVAALLGVVIAAVMLAFPQLRPTAVDPMQLVYLVVLLAFVVAAGGSLLRDDPLRALGQLAVWGIIGCLIALAYTYRDRLGFGDATSAGDAVVLPARPGPPPAAVAGKGTRTVTLYARGGHFFAEAEVEGRALTFMVDTGASVVALSRDDARRLGITPAERDYTVSVATANGTTRAAPVTLGTIGIGPIDVRYVEAVVIEGDMPGSLLGMSFLNRLAGYQVTGDQLVLKQ